MWILLLCIVLAFSVNFGDLGYTEDTKYALITLQCHWETFGGDRFGCRAVNLTTSSKRTFVKAVEVLSVSGPKSKSRTSSDVNTFYAYNANITFLPKQIGEHFPNLVNLIVSKTGLQYVEWRDFKNMKHLEVLKLNENKITLISQCAFEYLENLKSINLDGNKIHALHERTFTNLPQLTEFSACDNNLTHLNADIFRENRNLQTVLLSRNRLEVIEIDFHGWNIKKVDFRFNKCIDMKYICCAHAIFKNFTEHIKNNCGGPDFC